eukprot:Sdes_comp18818_c0_seq2m9232
MWKQRAISFKNIPFQMVGTIFTSQQKSTQPNDSQTSSGTNHSHLKLDGSNSSKRTLSSPFGGKTPKKCIQYRSPEIQRESERKKQRKKNWISISGSQFESILKDLNSQQIHLLEHIRTGHNLFITG